MVVPEAVDRGEWKGGGVASAALMAREEGASSGVEWGSEEWGEEGESAISVGKEREETAAMGEGGGTAAAVGGRAAVGAGAEETERRPLMPLLLAAVTTTTPSPWLTAFSEF
jgi:hypothetical protein